MQNTTNRYTWLQRPLPTSKTPEKSDHEQDYLEDSCYNSKLDDQRRLTFMIGNQMSSVDTDDQHDLWRIKYGDTYVFLAQQITNKNH